MRPSYALPAVLGALACLFPAAAAARSGPCLVSGEGPRCTLWTGTVTRVTDADTIDVDVDGDRSERPVHVRVTGIQAMEQTVYSSRASARRGDCHALEATARVDGLLRAGRQRVRLAARDPQSRSGKRMWRSVAVRAGGRWRDLGRVLVDEGHALWLPHGTEHPWNASYSMLAERAADAGRNLWDAAACGEGPEPDANLRVWVNSDADGSDDRNVNGEWVTVKNLDPLADVSLGGWWVRDSRLRRFTFPSDTVVPAGARVTVFAGPGTPGGGDFYWGMRFPVFDNVTSDERALGDGAYLFDPQGDLREWMTYPCRETCEDANAGAIGLDADAGPERVLLRNVSAFSVDLEGYRLESRPYGYAFGPDSVLEPGETLSVEIDDSQEPDTRLGKHWHADGPILEDGGDVVRLETFADVSIACDAWGSRSC